MTEEALPYPWPQKEHFMNAAKIFIDHKHTTNKQSFRTQIEKVLYLPFKDVTPPPEIQKINIMVEDLEYLHMESMVFMTTCLREISRSHEKVHVEVTYDYREIPDEPFYVLEISIEQ